MAILPPGAQVQRLPMPAVRNAFGANPPAMAPRMPDGRTLAPMMGGPQMNMGATAPRLGTPPPVAQPGSGEVLGISQMRAPGPTRAATPELMQRLLQMMLMQMPQGRRLPLS